MRAAAIPARSPGTGSAGEIVANARLMRGAPQGGDPAPGTSAPLCQAERREYHLSDTEGAGLSCICTGARSSIKSLLVRKAR